ncbi:MAG: pyrroloquinoline quinone biosynthesis protein B [Legionellales bacterium]|nr:pyrroloquinoline quinone biosynthesis protein B [Legionellales bacterium]
MPTLLKSPRLRIVLLGSAAGGGFPQWNCHCDSCQLAWSNKVKPQTQCSVAFTTDDVHWHLINASPDIRQQILNHPFLHPREHRHSPIKSFWLSCADIDTTSGLFQVREQTPFNIYGSKEVIQSIQRNPYYDAFNTDLVKSYLVKPGEKTILETTKIVSIAVPGKVPLYEESSNAASNTLNNLAFLISHVDGKDKALICPGAAKVTPELIKIASQCKLVLFDGTLYSNTELINQSLRDRLGEQMAHVAMGDENGTLAAFREIKSEKVYIHVNNSNPVWNPLSDAAQLVSEHGWKLGQDGMEWVLC